MRRSHVILQNGAWKCVEYGGPHEDAVLTLDCSKLRGVFGWRPRWTVEEAVARTVDWTRAWLSGQDASACMRRQIAAFIHGEEP